MDLTGLLTINGTDLWTTYGAYLAETSADAHQNMDALLRLPKAKDITYVDFRERHGEDAPDDPDIRLQAIDRTLQLCLRADSEALRLARYRALLALLTGGWLQVAVKDYGTYRMVYKDMPDDPQWFKAWDGTYGVLFRVTLHEPQPAPPTDA